MDNHMKNCLWETSDDFQNLNEFEHFKKWLDRRISLGGSR
jgi:hypothetical protein